MSDDAGWPPLPLAEWADTYTTLHMWTQIIGKIRLALAPRTNHWWEVPLYVTARGLTTSPIPDRGRVFEIDFDFVAHRLAIEVADGRSRTIALAPRTVADFYRLVRQALQELEIAVHIWPMPVEVPSPIRFDQDHEHAAYDAERVNRWWRVLVQVDAVLKEFRARFTGKCSPVHFFWGSFDLAVTRFSGRRAPLRDDPIMREAYSHEVISAGFWPGGGPVADAAFYAYAAPEPDGFRTAGVRPATAFYQPDAGEYLLMYDAVRAAPSPRDALLTFLQSSYEAAADRAGWNRGELERQA